MARSARWRACERTSLSRVLTLIGRQYEGPDLTPLTYLLNNSETTCSKRFFHADFKLKEFCNGYFHLVLSVPVPMKKIKTKTKKQTLFYRCKMETQGLWSSVVLCPGAPCLEQSSSPHPTQLLPFSSKLPLRHSSSLLPSPSYVDSLKDLRFVPPHRLLMFVCC